MPPADAFRACSHVSDRALVHASALACLSIISLVPWMEEERGRLGGGACMYGESERV